jgi:hypothetical protein
LVHVFKIMSRYCERANGVVDHHIMLVLARAVQLRYIMLTRNEALSTPPIRNAVSRYFCGHRPLSSERNCTLAEYTVTGSCSTSEDGFVNSLRVTLKEHERRLFDKVNIQRTVHNFTQICVCIRSPALRNRFILPFGQAHAAAPLR